MSENYIDAPELDYLYVAESGIPDSGMGLFTAIDIFRDERIAVYEGEIISNEEADRRILENKNAYFMNLANGKILDAMNSNCFARYANDADGLHKSDYKNNAYIGYDDEDRVCLFALRKIRAGEEVFCSYGKKYWIRK